MNSLATLAGRQRVPGPARLPERRRGRQGRRRKTAVAVQGQGAAQNAGGTVRARAEREDVPYQAEPAGLLLEHEPGRAAAAQSAAALRRRRVSRHHAHQRRRRKRSCAGLRRHWRRLARPDWRRRRRGVSQRKGRAQARRQRSGPARPHPAGPR